jgi:hypothetical protein
VRRRRPPRLVVEYELERQHARVMLLACTHEDELRLRAWLRGSTVFEVLPALVEWVLDDLDRLDDEGRAA